MKKLTAPVTILLLLALVAPGYGRSIPTRVAEKEYTAAGYYDAAGLFYAQNYCMGVNDINTGGACFDVRPGERTVSVDVRDESGVPVKGRIILRGKPDVFFCRATKGPVTLPPTQQEVAVSLGVEGCGGQPSVPTRGVIAATFD
jgi:hypothetical protein